jgi:hypothetical protein
MASTLADEERAHWERQIAAADLDGKVTMLAGEDQRAKQIEEITDMIKAAIKTELEAVGFQPGQSYLPPNLNGYGMLYSQRTTPKVVDRELLILASIDPATVDACTVGGVPGKPFVQLVRPKEPKK